MKRKEQVAAVCFRTGAGGIQFLLVRTDRGRWTFPKGGSEPGLTRAQAAALEAFEEAGVHGRIEETSFTTYIDRKSRRKRGGASRNDTAVYAHLCEVFWHTRPQESYREPTWLSPEKAKRRLQRDRSSESAKELVRVLELATARIQRLSNGVGPEEALQHVYFEALDDSSAVARRISIEPLPRAVVRRVVPEALSPRWNGPSEEPSHPRLLPAVSTSAGKRALGLQAFVYLPRLPCRSGEN